MGKKVQVMRFNNIIADYRLDYFFIYLLSATFFYYFQFQSPFLNSNDGYYHIKFAYILRTEGFIDNFKWATFSVWKDQFSDKDFLFHVFLIPFTYFENLELGMKIATVILASFATTSFYIIMKLNKVNFAWLWLLILLCSGAYFLYRVNCPRPQVLSILMALWTVHFILNNYRYRLAIISFLYCTAYTASFLPLLFCLIASGYRFVFEKEIEWRLPLYSLIGFLLGMILHPYFPKNWSFMWLQNFYVLFLQKTNQDLHMAGEFKPMDTRNLLYSNTAILIAYVAAFFTSMIRPRRIDSKTGQVFLLSLAMLILTAHSKRFTEYSIPFTLLFCSLFFSYYFKDWSSHLSNIKNKYQGFKIASVALGFMTVMTFLSFSTIADLRVQYRRDESRYKSAALTIKDQLAKDEVIFTCDWDDAPELWFYNSDNRYLVFLDPSFMYYWSPEKWRKWYHASNGLLGEKTYNVLKNDFNIRYGICTSEFQRLRQILKQDSRVEIIHESKKAYAFKLN